MSNVDRLIYNMGIELVHDDSGSYHVIFGCKPLYDDNR